MSDYGNVQSVCASSCNAHWNRGHTPIVCLRRGTMAVEHIVFRKNAVAFQDTLLHSVTIQSPQDIWHWFSMVAYCGAWATSLDLPVATLMELKWALPRRKLPRLVSLCIRGCTVVSPSISFVNSILDITTLSKLHIDNLGAHHFAIVHLLHGLGRLPSLTDLLIPYPDSGDDDVGYRAVATIHTVAPQLRCLTIRDMDAFDAGDVVANLCTSHTSLVQLNVTNGEPVKHDSRQGIALTCDCRTLPRRLIHTSHNRFRQMLALWARIWPQALRIYTPASCYAQYGDESILTLFGHVRTFELFASGAAITSEFMHMVARLPDGIPLEWLVLHLDVTGDVDVAPLQRLLCPISTPLLQYVELHLTGDIGIPLCLDWVPVVKVFTCISDR